MNQAVLNYTILDPDCLEFTKSVHLYMLSRTGDVCAGRSSCSVVIDRIEEFHSSRVEQLCPAFGASIFKRICLSVVYMCVSLTGVPTNIYFVLEFYLS